MSSKQSNPSFLSESTRLKRRISSPRRVVCHATRFLNKNRRQVVGSSRERWEISEAIKSMNPLRLWIALCQIMSSIVKSCLSYFEKSWEKYVGEIPCFFCHYKGCTSAQWYQWNSPAKALRIPMISMRIEIGPWNNEIEVQYHIWSHMFGAYPLT